MAAIRYVQRDSHELNCPSGYAFVGWALKEGVTGVLLRP